MLIFTLILYDLHKNGLVIWDSTIVVHTILDVFWKIQKECITPCKILYKSLYTYTIIVPTYILIKKYEIG